ncbi:hypothetical protein BO99DRAFT_417726 [Aspergillus violaceofuscus CBS 115571]|uniref:Uncharacterized protein n=1 Tax=Aspergillus violaceofuscus (strain CBS 115571) TaxID=1450538 RepID=A0A2V5GQC9_ASPV1|nr:hypothetical protein BO99DRAFT_417726 [Aspergillus violaceofuscus CBS 115571]
MPQADTTAAVDSTIDISPDAINKMALRVEYLPPSFPRETRTCTFIVLKALYSETAFLELMYILHGQDVDPKRYDRLSKLIDLATVCNQWGCEWDRVPDMGTSIALALRNDPYWVDLDTAMEWAWVAWFFWETDVFEQATAYVIGHSENRISARPLRLPENVCEIAFPGTTEKPSYCVDDIG